MKSEKGAKVDVAAPRFLKYTTIHNYQQLRTQLLEIDVKYAIKPFGYIEQEKYHYPTTLFLHDDSALCALCY